ncbi:GNAT family N-acetyltransferase [Streptomyces xinghaiensis]|uniref:N-acetyltransferase n=2 Tax=Streptomyces TaxID=1883 RepID=A0A3R7H6T3_9ACTN|nr:MULTISPECIES: GNAT family N-acetyltransferase [Streptomyces]KNE80133.1 hypothetical protein ADZ36_23610 [Streptomyces fradiae]OFA50966.1 GNAT family N-acetyltransferase [Streptomyces fradiae]PQM19538.1 N-acetyltransferase [Streptomyces xinghaiensis]RKM90962.1 N-acetyltransferase [Streptomyces xinghaiensis]RNC68963.1 N-acetyltransferase [Streptomyces xinghaiensis]
MAKKKNKRPQPSPRLTRPRLLDGLPGPGRTRIRLARPEDSDQFGALLEAATGDVEQAHLDAVAASRCGAWLLDGLSGGARTMIEPLARADANGDLSHAALALALPLVAEGRDRTLAGALLALPPGTVVQTVRDAGYEQHALLAMLKYAKIKALAVAEDARGQGLGAALLKRCIQVYWQLDFMLLYGQFEPGRALGPFYDRSGFTVLPPGQATDIGYVLTGRPIGLGAGPGEQLFFRWNRN